jgi:alpha-beta hydrolase superfamily lysophospholipase
MRLLVLILCCFLTLPVTAREPDWYEDFVFSQSHFCFEFIRVLGYAGEGGADLGECVATARQICDGDERSWYEQWRHTADRIAAQAAADARAGRLVSARQGYLRACGYYRTAGFFMRSPDMLESALKTSRQSRECFAKAMESTPNVRAVRIPYENTALPGYFLTAGSTASPLLVVHSGYDGTAEELYFEIGRAAQRRGYHCLLFEGPGQGAVIREQGLPFRHDWEAVVGPVLDWAQRQPEVDERIALMGISMGGYLAPRAAAFEPRIKALVCNGGVYDLGGAVTSTLPTPLMEILESEPAEFNQALAEQMERNGQARWYFSNGLWTFSVSTLSEFVTELQKYNLLDVASQIECPTLVVDGAAETMLKGQSQSLYQELKCPKTLLVFDRESTGQAHCQMGAQAISQARILDWLDETMESAALLTR